MSNNLALAIESLGTKLTCNFDRLSNEQAKIIDTLAHAQTTQQQTKVEVKTGSASADEKVTVTTTTVTKDAEDTGDRDEAVEEKVSVSVAEEKARTESTTKVEEKAEAKTESSTKVEEVAETKTETTTTTTEVKSEEKVEVDVVVEEEEKPAKDADAETIEVEVMDAVCEPVSEPASAHEPVLTPEPIIAPKPAPAPEPAPAAAAKPAATEKVTITVQKDSDEHRRAETFKAHLRAANFAFHTNPYASSFFQHGFSEVGMPSYIRNPCMMQSPYTGVTECSCALSSCASCLTTKLSSMGYAVTQMQVSSLLSVYNGDSARVIDYVTR
ncbi:hypothetical protein GGI02_003309 [Coemansia sp. RSA 2322]|nr:hypothetical protein GGI02_003309 [Coemansia sp. RSA 2322]